MRPIIDMTITPTGHPTNPTNVAPNRSESPGRRRPSYDVVEIIPKTLFSHIPVPVAASIASSVGKPTAGQIKKARESNFFPLLQNKDEKKG